MPDIRLQDYVSKIRDLIENDRQDEAIAHGQQVLHYFPKHVETYALLGEAFLERGLLQEATELFQRALSGDPENLTARVGLGMIYDQQGLPPEAIWQMERAFALAPGNPEVRRELGRLYGERDGEPEARLKLTRDALGRLYVRNGLFERAITEFRAVLRLDPDLPDIQVALVESLWREGRRLETVETCLSVLEQMPNCLKANLILGEIWLRAGHNDMAMEKLNTARALDPENLVAQEMMGGDSPLPFEEVYLPELQITDEEIQRLIARLAPAAAVTFAREATEETGPEEVPGAGEVPDWLQEFDDVEGPGLEEPQSPEGAPERLTEPPAETAAPMPQAAESQDEMPEWLREAAAPEAVEAQTPAPAAIAATSEQRAQLQQQVETEPGNGQARLALARLCRTDKDLDASLGHYEKLIADPELRPQVVDDLGSLAKENEDQSQVFQLLGDAHMKDDQLDQALEMYRKAIDALRKT